MLEKANSKLRGVVMQAASLGKPEGGDEGARGRQWQHYRKAARAHIELQGHSL